MPTQSTTVRTLRQIEITGGIAGVPGAFVKALARSTLDTEGFSDLAESLPVGQRMTAQREIAEIKGASESDIDLLWMTDE
ncbi:MAG: hypothetical protein ACWA49_09735 [Ruegeria sp.]